MKDYPTLKAELAKSKFRSRFQLKEEHRKLIAHKGWHTIAGQAEQIIRTRLAPALPENDGNGEDEGDEQHHGEDERRNHEAYGTEDVVVHGICRLAITSLYRISAPTA